MQVSVRKCGMFGGWVHVAVMKCGWCSGGGRALCSDGGRVLDVWRVSLSRPCSYHPSVPLCLTPLPPCSPHARHPLRPPSPNSAQFSLTSLPPPSHPPPPPTDCGLLLEKLSYTAPEAAVDGPATAASDVWSFGVILNEMVMGKVRIREGARGTLGC